MSIREKDDGFSNVPPRDGLTDERFAWQSVVTGAAAVSASLWSGYADTDAPKGKVWVEFEASGAGCHFRLSRTATTATTTANGNGLQVGGWLRVAYLVDPQKDLFVDVIAAGVGLFKWRMCSTEVDRNRQ